VEGESGTALALIHGQRVAFQISAPAVSVAGTNGLLRYLLETIEDGWEQHQLKEMRVS
jgi:hypothetical protein